MTRRNDCRPRRGLSKFELLACLTAVAGGVWIGAQYVGLDLHGAAYQALDESTVLEQIPADWRPANPQCPNGDCPNPAELLAAEQARLRSELEDLRVEVALITAGGSLPEGAIGQGAVLSEAELATREATLNYWQGLTQVVFDVTSIQDRVVPFTGAGDHARTLAVRRRALEYGREAASLLPTDGVDREAVAAGVRVGEWFEQGAKALQTAVNLRGSQAIDGRAAPAGEVWSQTEGDLRQRTDLVRRTTEEASAHLSARYFIDFAPLGL